MRRSAVLLASAFCFSAPLLAQVSCPAGSTTSISGVVYAPNQNDPLPNVTVYVSTASAPLDPFVPGVGASCPAPSATLPGNPIVGTTTGVDGSFTISGVPVATNVPVVIVSGSWRRQITVDTTGNVCGNTVVDPSLSRFPRTQSEGDIPKFAIATGSVDQVECVLRKVGVADSEFTNPGGAGRIQLYQGDGSALAKNLPTRTSGGAIIDSTTPAESVLMGTQSTLNGFDVLMLPCEGGDYSRPTPQLQNLVSFANAGGRVYSSHFAYSWLWTNSPFNTVATWTGNQGNGTASGTAYVNTGFSEGQTLAAWLQLPAINASPTPDEITLYTIKNDFSAINTAINQSWLTLNSTTGPVMQFVFDTPVGQATGQCGRVLFNEYHVENKGQATNTNYDSNNVLFPNECSSAIISPQEKLLEYSLFELTNNGGQATLTPATQDFGTVPVNFASAPQTFVFTNNSTFQTTVSLLTATGDFSASGCNGTIAGGTSCNITVVFTPTALGARTGTLSVGSGAQTLTASLTGTGVPDLTVSPTSLTFGSVDVGATATLPVTVTNSASAGVPMTALTTTGDYSATTTCPATVPANSTCQILVTFKPTASGTRTGSVGPSNPNNAAYGNMTVTLTGNGLDFGLALAPSSGQVIAGYSATTVATMTPMAGFAAPVTITCAVAAPGSTCLAANSTIAGTAAVSTNITITTTSQYTVVGYGSIGVGVFGIFAVLSGWLLYRRRSAMKMLPGAMVLIVLLAAGTFLTGCSGKLPAANGNPTSPGTYAYTVSATDGTITHTATYSLTVTTK